MTLAIHGTGTPAGPTVVFRHGVGTSGWMWRAQADQFPEFHSLVPDLPGHGRSNRTPWVSRARTAGAVADLIRARAVGGRAHLVGLSLGGYVATQLLAAAPEVVDRAVIGGVNVLPFPHPGRMRLRGYAMAPFMATDYMLRLHARGLKVPDALYDGYRQAARAMPRRAFLRIGDELLRFRLPAGVGRAHRPALVVAGEREHAPIHASLRAFLAASSAPASGPGHWRWRGGRRSGTRPPPRGRKSS